MLVRDSPEQPQPAGEPMGYSEAFIDAPGMFVCGGMLSRILHCYLLLFDYSLLIDLPYNHGHSRVGIGLAF